MDIHSLRKEFPILNIKVNNKILVYLDNGATSQKPQSVIDCINEYYATYNANIHRGVHYLSQFATSAYEEAREKISSYINSPSAKQVIFTKGTTDGINLVANGFSRGFLKEGDEVVISAMEHHSNIVPWQLACEYTGANLKVIPVLDNGELDEIALANVLTDKVKILALTHVSNTLGTINPVKKIIELAHQKVFQF
jgi:cysteine desulfurase/selenocysteine lyase